MPRILPLVLALHAAACASPGGGAPSAPRLEDGAAYAERLAHPRVDKKGWVAAETIAPESVDPAERALMAAFAASSDRQFAHDCHERRLTEWVRAERLAPSDAALAELSGADGVVVRHRVIATACGASRLHALYSATRAGRIIPGVPGDSIASLGLQREVLQIVAPQAAGIIAASFEEGGCDPMADQPWVRDTALVSNPVDGAWRELWTLSACGRTRDVEISFEETDDGATFRAPIYLE